MDDFVDRTSVERASSAPVLSVVVVTVYNSDHLARCLDALDRQVDPPDMEVIVTYHDGVGSIEAVKDKHPQARFYRVPGRQTQVSLRAVGVRHARGRIVAITVDHCTPDVGWCGQVIKAHQGPFAAVGGAVEKGNQPDTLSNWAVHLYDYCNYGRYLSPFPEGPAQDLSDCNVSYKSEILSAIAALWKDKFDVSLLNREIVAHGETLWLSPDPVVYQNRDIDFRRALCISFQRGRAFASARSAIPGSRRRLFYLLLSPLLPVILLKRFAANVLTKRSRISIGVRTMPFVATISVLWSLGEFVSYLTGEKNMTLGVTEE